MDTEPIIQIYYDNKKVTWKWNKQISGEEVEQLLYHVLKGQITHNAMKHLQKSPILAPSPSAVMAVSKGV